MSAILDNIFWHALTGAQAHFAQGEGGARRYARGFSPILAFARPDAPDFAALDGCCASGERFYCAGWSGAAPPGWTIEAETTMFRMFWDAPTPPPENVPEAQPLAGGDVPQMLGLTAITEPGPFGPRTIELGDYVGVREAGRLIAMAGERAQAAGFREISGVCTLPEAQGRGWAGRLMRILVARQLQRGQTPFLHVMRGNAHARQLYLRMGFRDHCETVVRVITRH